MKSKPDIELTLEPERYELLEGPAYRFEIARRDFFKTLGGGILIAFALKDTLSQEQGGGRRGGAVMPREIGAWLHVGEDGSVTVLTGKVEVGQGIRTSLAQVVAEELRVGVETVRLVMGDTDLTPYDMGTFGSMTTRVMSPQLRRAAAAAREVLMDLAAEQLKVKRNELVVAEGKVAHPPTKQSLEFGRLTRGQRIAGTIAENVPTTPPDQWRVVGKPVLKVNARDLVTGKHQFATDIKQPQMLHGKVLRAPAQGATLVSVDTSQAEGIAGVSVVRDGDFVGVVGPSEQAATLALNRIKADWRTTPGPSSHEIFDYLKKNTAGGQGSENRSGFNLGSIEQGLAAAQHKLQQSYTVAYIAHVPLEPRAAVAEWKEGKLTVWTGTQRPFGVRGELARAFHIPEDRVRVIMPDTGSGYGGKHSGEAAIEAARLAKAAGKPVKLIWTREEEFAWAYLRPAGVIYISGGVTADGRITAWEFHNYNSGGAAIRTAYDIPNQKIEFHPSRSPLRQGSYRALAATANHFARETHMDELAHAVKMDPLEFRLKNLKDDRLRAVLEAAAQRFGWGKSKPASGRGYGIAGGFEKGSYVATCAEVEVDRASGSIKVIRTVTAFECGAIINPDGLKNQIEGSIVMGLGGALFEAIQFEGGKILNGRLSRYRVPRFSDVPAIDIVLLDRKDLPSVGAGETPIVAIAPAVGNAVFAATGNRLRSLPMGQVTARAVAPEHSRSE
jgi:isoquinoline 1-oxidoreductase